MRPVLRRDPVLRGEYGFRRSHVVDATKLDDKPDVAVDKLLVAHRHIAHPVSCNAPHRRHRAGGKAVERELDCEVLPDFKRSSKI